MAQLYKERKPASTTVEFVNHRGELIEIGTIIHTDRLLLPGNVLCDVAWISAEGRSIVDAHIDRAFEPGKASEFYYLDGGKDAAVFYDINDDSKIVGFYRVNATTTNNKRKGFTLC